MDADADSLRVLLVVQWKVLGADTENGTIGKRKRRCPHLGPAGSDRLVGFRIVALDARRAADARDRCHALTQVGDRGHEHTDRDKCDDRVTNLHEAEANQKDDQRDER